MVMPARWDHSRGDAILEPPVDEPRVEVVGPGQQLERRHQVGRAQLSPDDLWVAYASSESGKMEVYVSPFPT
jgi:hypothetical protein